MDTVELIAEHTRRLPEGVQREVLDFVEYLRSKYSLPLAQPVVSTTRQAGLHAGCAMMAADFDAPLSDNFWLGME